MLFSIYMRSDFSSCIVYPGIAIGMICVPVSIEQLRDRVRTKPVESLQNSWLRYSETGVDKKFALLSRENPDISSGALQYADLATQRV